MFDLKAIQGLQLHSSHGNGGHWWSFLLFAGANNAQSSLFLFFLIFPMYNVLVRLSFANSQSASLFSDPGAFVVCVSVSVSDWVFMMAQQSAGCQDYFHAAICWPVGNFRTRESTSTPCSLIPHPTPAGFPLSGHVPILFTCRIKGIPFRLVFTPEFFVSFYCDLILFSVCHTFFFCLAIYTL